MYYKYNNETKIVLVVILAPALVVEGFGREVGVCRAWSGTNMQSLQVFFVDGARFKFWEL